MYRLMKESPRIENGILFYSVLGIENLSVFDYAFDFDTLSVECLKGEQIKIKSSDDLMDLFSEVCQTTFDNPIEALWKGILLTDNCGCDYYTLNEFEFDYIGLGNCYDGSIRWIKSNVAECFNPQIAELI